MPFAILPTNSISGGYDITNSLRFNSGSSDSLSRTPASATNRRTWTWSGWVKKCKILPDYPALFSASNSIPDTVLRFDGANDSLNAILENGGGGNSKLVTTQVFRDLSAWYHIVWAVDTTLATANNRQRLYINGTEVTDFASRTNPSQNFDTQVNNTVTTRIGTDRYGSFPDFYLSDIYLIDGQQLTPSSFGETDEDTGIWKPKAFSGTYGTNGFALFFKNSASLGTDSSGNGNTFTVNNLTSIDQTTDTPTNNFCTMNPLDNYYFGGTFSDGNTTVLSSSSPFTYCTSNLGVGKGKWYIEAKWTSGSNLRFGIVNTPSVATDDNPGNSAGEAVYRSDGAIVLNGTETGGYGSSFASGDILSIALDCDNSKIYFGKNGVYQASGVPSAGTGGTTITNVTTLPSGNYFFAFGDNDGGATSTVSYNFGNPPYSANSYTDGAGFGNFSYAVPSGFFALCTKNLAQYG